LDQTDQTGIRAVLLKATRHHHAGRLDEAERAYLEALSLGRRRLDILPMLAAIATQRGDLDAALSRWREVLEIEPGNLDALKQTASLSARLGRWAVAAEALTAAAAVSANDPFVIANLGVALFEAGRHDEALVALDRAAARRPGDPVAIHRRRHAVASLVPHWHIPMMNDDARNQAFERGILRALALKGPSARVLDIGTGSGLLSMMAARAGASGIIACEAVPAIADAARRVIAANGYGDRIQVLAKPSRALVLGEDLDRPADILVSEILSGDLLSEQVLPTFEDAVARLAAPGAILLPRAVAAVGCLVGGDALMRLAFAGSASGFDLTAFGHLGPPRLPVDGLSPPWQRLSEDFDLVEIDLHQRLHAPVIETRLLPVTGDGIAVGLLQWLRLDLGGDIRFANSPEQGSPGGWRQILHSFERPVAVKAGQSLQVAIGHERSSLIVVLPSDPVVETWG
jgi:type II protein arginine methyltransferase